MQLETYYLETPDFCLLNRKKWNYFGDFSNLDTFEGLFFFLVNPDEGKYNTSKKENRI